ncbi:MAG: oxidoreductase [Actinomycetota bacterium]|nr:oxidoreductase [Actinomycetota bacterium]
MPDSDPLAVLAARPEVAAASAAARTEVDALLWRRDVRAAAKEVAAASVDRGGRDSAAIDGADVVEPDDSPMGRVLGAALRLTAEVPRHVDVFATAPLQVLAHLHAVVAHGFLPADDLGRPRAGTQADDPLHLGPPPPATAAAERLMALAQVLTHPTEAPATVVAAVAHAELASARPFAWGSGLLGRASTRLVLAGRGVDPSLFSIPEHGMLEQGRPAYVSALRGYATGTPDGVSAFLVWHATAIALGARAATVP